MGSSPYPDMCRPPSLSGVIQKSFSFICHSGLDPESPAYRQAGVFLGWIPAGVYPVLDTGRE
jgi:hypothetical protein